MAASPSADSFSTRATIAVGDRSFGSGRGARPAVASADRAAAIRAPRPGDDPAEIVIPL